MISGRYSKAGFEVTRFIPTKFNTCGICEVILPFGVILCPTCFVEALLDDEERGGY